MFGFTFSKYCVSVVEKPKDVRFTISSVQFGGTFHSDTAHGDLRNSGRGWSGAAQGVGVLGLRAVLPAPSWGRPDAVCSPQVTAGARGPPSAAWTSHGKPCVPLGISSNLFLFSKSFF